MVDYKTKYEELYTFIYTELTKLQLWELESSLVRCKENGDDHHKCAVCVTDDLHEKLYDRFNPEDLK